MDARRIREAYLIGDNALEKLKNARVAIFGIGGVGSFCAEALVRMGVGHITFADNDTVSVSNINRQLVALSSTIGEMKTEVMKRRALDIDPNVDIEVRNMFYLPETADSFDISQFDCIVDAIDTVSAKFELIRRANEAGIPIVSCMGTGNKLHPEMLEITDIYKTSVCPLAKVMRGKLRAAGIKKLRVVYSKEEPRKPHADYEGKTEVPENKRQVPGSISFVPPTAGMLLASEVFHILTGTK